jgi:acetyl esterase/lipase
VVDRPRQARAIHHGPDRDGDLCGRLALVSEPGSPPHDPRDVLARPAPRPSLALAYGGGSEQVADVWLPAALADGDRAPLLIAVHGGFWREEHDRTHLGHLAAAMAGRGWAVAVPEYRRTGASGGWPATFDDVAAAVDRLPALVGAAVAERGLRLLPRAVLLGHSAGGHLVLWAASRHRLPAGSRWYRAAPGDVAAVVALAPVARLAEAARAGLDEGAAELLVGGTPEQVPQRYAEADPSGLLPSGVPTVVLHGENDAQASVRMSVSLAADARAAGDAMQLTVLPGVEHFGLIDPLAPAFAHTVAALDALAG